MARRHRHRSCVPLLIAAGSFLVTAEVSGHAARLTWAAPAQCPDAAELRSSVERLLGEPLIEGDAFAASATVTPDADGRFTLVLSVRTPEGDGTRTVRAETCEAALKVAAFGIALAINPELATAPPREETSEIPAEPAPPPRSIAPPPVAPPQPAPKPVARAPVELWLGARAVLDTSLLPSLSAGFGGFADLLLSEHIRAGIGGNWFVPQRQALDAGDGGVFSLWFLDVHVCWQDELGIPLAACPSFQVGNLHGEGRGVPARLSQDSRLVAPGLTLLGMPALTRRLSAVVAASGLFPLGRDSFVVNAGTVHEVPAFSLELWAGVALRAL